jgi:surface antigen
LGNKVHGDAGKWYAAAVQAKLPTGTTPVVGAVFVRTTGGLGHVGVVTKVTGKTTFTAKEMNGGRGGTAANSFETSEFGVYREHPHDMTKESIKFIYKPGTEPGTLSKYIGHIVQRSGDKKAQKTAWLVGPDLRRRWIPDIATYNCLKARGAPGPDVLPVATLDKLKDRTGVRATCTPPTTPPATTSPPPTRHVYHVHNTCADHSCGLLVETAPGSHYGGKVIGTLKDGTAVNIRCQTVGGMITGGEGSNDVWDQIDYGSGIGYVADLYIDTPGDEKPQSHRYFTRSIPKC